MNSKDSGGRLERFLTGKGFYIVLVLCAAVIGASAWMMAVGTRNAVNDVTDANRRSLDSHRTETVILPHTSTEETLPVQGGRTESVQVTQEPRIEIEPAETAPVQATAPPVRPAAGPLYAWPVEGELERRHDPQRLVYDVTMRDWRTHEGVDIAAPLGATVTAAHAGSVESIVHDDLYGTVVTVYHGDGGRTVYANLADVPAVHVGDWVEIGAVIGSIGDTALCEVGQGTHLHFAVTVDGVDVDPLLYLPA